MLTKQLRSNIDKKWEGCWPVNDLKPLALIDAISFLLFAKLLDESGLSEKSGISIVLNNATGETGTFNWQAFKDMDAVSRHTFFTKEKGLLDMLKIYSESGLPYSLFIQSPLLLVPSSVLLASLINIIGLMEAENVHTRAAIFQYLLNKTGMQSQSGQVYAPAYINNLVVSMLQPTQEDVIWDPVAGNGNLLVNSAIYAGANNNIASGYSKSGFAEENYIGTEQDLVQARICAMNMILHGIKNPAVADPGPSRFDTAKPPTIIVSDLFFNASEENSTDTAATDKRSTEINFLDTILHQLQKGGRAAVLIRETVLNDDVTDISRIRRQIVEDHKLEAVISLPLTNDSLFSGGCLIIFSKKGISKTDYVWFCKMEIASGIVPSNNLADDITTYSYEDAEVKDLLSRWKNKEKGVSEKCMYVSASDIRNNKYNLSFNKYKLLVHKQISDISKPVLPTGQDILKKQMPKKQLPAIHEEPPYTETPPGRRRSLPVIMLLLLIIAALLSYILFYKNNDTDIITAAVVAPRESPAPTEQKTNEQPAATPAKVVKQITDSIAKPAPAVIKPNVQANVLKKDSVFFYKNKPAKLLVRDTTRLPGMRKVYTVKSIAYFHDAPDAISIRTEDFIDSRSNATLTPVDEQNGFIYVVYTNEYGETAKGWLKKQDLKVIR